MRALFFNFDARRAGVCEPSKLGACIALLRTELTEGQRDCLLASYRSSRPGYEGCFEWGNFVGDMEALVGFRM